MACRFLTRANMNPRFFCSFFLIRISHSSLVIILMDLIYVLWEKRKNQTHG